MVGINKKSRNQVAKAQYTYLYISIIMESIKHERILLGVDPGTSVMGYGIIKVVEKKLSLLSYGVIQLSKYDNHAQKLRIIAKRIDALLDEYVPDELAIEAPFYGKNVQSMLKLGRAQGVVLGCALRRDIPCSEFAPKRIKQAVCGNGNASKEQVAAMTMQLLNIKEQPKFLDTTDALGAALCLYFNVAESGNNFDKKSTGAGKVNSWNDFLNKNPKRKLG